MLVGSFFHKCTSYLQTKAPKCWFTTLSYVDTLRPLITQMILMITSALNPLPQTWSPSQRESSNLHTMDVASPHPRNVFGTTRSQATSRFHSLRIGLWSLLFFPSLIALYTPCFLQASQDPSMLHHTRARSCFQRDAPMCLDVDPSIALSHKSQIGHASLHNYQTLAHKQLEHT